MDTIKETACSQTEVNDAKKMYSSIENDQNAVVINPENDKRHCAYCLQVLSTVKLCGGCHKRAYCSRECQKEDWKNGQGHKNWCKLGCGEEDVDWKVDSIPGKGLGLIAKRMFPAKSRIMVDAVCPRTHPGVKDLQPINGTTREKFDLNCLGTDNDLVLCLRIARANHSCDPNACHHYDETFNVKILFAERDIQIGEEICISYVSPFSVVAHYDAKGARRELVGKWGIICNKDCICYDNAIAKKSDTLKVLDKEIANLVLASNPSAALKLVKEALDIHDEIHSSWIEKIRTLYFRHAKPRKGK